MGEIKMPELNLEQKMKAIQYISEHQDETLGAIAAHLGEEFGVVITTKHMLGILMLMERRDKNLKRGV